MIQDITVSQYADRQAIAHVQPNGDEPSFPQINRLADSLRPKAELSAVFFSKDAELGCIYFIVKRFIFTQRQSRLSFDV